MGDGPLNLCEPSITATQHILPFDLLSPLDFERLCLALLPHEGFDNPQHFGAAGSEQGRDIVTYRDGKLWYVQCKRVKRCGPKVLLDEIEKICELVEHNPDLHPCGMLFIVSCEVSATARDRAGRRCSELGLAHETWARTDLEARVRKHPEIVYTFFGRRTFIPSAPSLRQIGPPPRDFVGRTNEINNFTTQIQQRGGAIISGLGGVGKTALALVLAKRMSSDYPDAQLSLHLRGTTKNPVTTADAMAHVIRYLQPGAEISHDLDELRAQYLSALHEKSAIVFLDDAQDAAQVAPLLPPASCLVLVTSRQRFAVPGLSPTTLDTLPAEDACRLLLEIDHRIDHHAAKIAELCGYLPLAVRAAGGMMAERVDLEPEELERRLSNARQQLEFVDASFSLSYDLLDSDMQRMWCMLAVFPGEFDRQAAAAIWGLQYESAWNVLGKLVKRCVLEWNPVGKRYHLHELVRLFLNSRLGEADRATSQRRHSLHFLDIARGASRLLGTEHKHEVLGVLDESWTDLQLAHRFLVDSQSLEIREFLYEFHFNLFEYCDRRGLWRENVEMLKDSVDALKAVDSTRRNLGKLQMQLGKMHRRQLGNLDAALEHGQAGLKHVYPDGLPRDPAAAEDFRLMGDTHRVRGEFAQALEYYEVAEELLDAEQYARDLGKLLSSIGEAYAFSGTSLEQALTAARRSLSLHQESGDEYETAQSYRILAGVHLSRGEIEAAEHNIGKARSLFEKLGQERNPLMGWILRTQGEVYRLRGDRPSAHTCFKQAQNVFQKRRVGVGMAIVLEKLGLLHLDSGNTKSALDYLDRAITQARAIKGAKFALAQTLYSRVRAAAETSCWDDQAQACLDELKFLVGHGEDLAVLRVHLAHLLKQSTATIGVATSVSGAPQYDPVDTLSYALTHRDFRMIQVHLNESIIVDRGLRSRLTEAAHRQGIEVICHAPDRMRSGPAIARATIEAARDLLAHNPRKWVVHHFDEHQSVSRSLDVVKELVEAGLVPCIENYHLDKSLRHGQRHYELYLDLFRRTSELGLDVCAVLDIPRLFDAKLGLVDAGAAVALTSRVFRCLEDLGVTVILHLIDSESFDLARSNWCPLGTGAIPYNELLPQMFAPTTHIEAVVFEFEDKHNPVDSLPFLRECMREGISAHDLSLSVQWWG
jgi:tetratricopeptide (TPR) repeat protein